MVRHIFIAPIKDGVAEEKINEKTATMREMKNRVPGIQALTVGKNTGWVGIKNAVSMVIDVEDKAAFDAFLTHPFHVAISDAATDVFDTDYLDKETFDKAEEIRMNRATALGRVRELEGKPASVFPASFSMPVVRTVYQDPFEQAAYVYSLIEREVSAVGIE